MTGDTRMPTLLGRVDALARATTLLESHLPGEQVQQARDLVERARGRLRHGTSHTVVGVAGQTGAGKSSLVNALVGAEVTRVGVRRPTTSRTQAVVHGPGADDLLDWLQVGDRHVAPRDPQLEGLVLLDLPDIDSVAVDHHLEAHRLIDVVDLLVFVTDPQKYADQALHDGVLAPLAGHDEVVEVLLNQVDLLSPAEVEACLDDLRRRLKDDGLTMVVPLPVSAATGEGVTALRAMLADTVRTRQATVARWTADLTATGRALMPPGADDGSRGLPRAARSTGVAGLADAVGVDAVAEAVSGQYRRDARLRTGWPVTRWMARWRRSPMADVPVIARSRVATDQVRATLRSVGEQAGAHLGDPWDRVVRDAVRTQESEVVEDLADVTTRGIETQAARPRWWTAVGATQRALLLAALAGGAWLLALLLARSFLLVDTEPWTPRWRGVPVPTLLVAGGVAAGWLVALASRLASRVGARRRARRVRRQLARAVGEVVDGRVSDSVSQVLEDHARIRRLLTDVVTGATP